LRRRGALGACNLLKILATDASTHLNIQASFTIPPFLVAVASPPHDKTLVRHFCNILDQFVCMTHNCRVYSKLVPEFHDLQIFLFHNSKQEL
jgi:hypothetical protein